MINRLYDLYKKYPEICTDTRNVKKGSIFFALKGGSFNGNKFAQDALDKGCEYAIIDEKEYLIDDRTILVDNVLKSLQLIANKHRKSFNVPFIGITGTNGKTTTKELIVSILKQKYKVYYTHGNLNNHIGVPLTLLSIKNDCEIAVIEMGANHIGEINDLCEIACPDYGIITNIGKAHLEGFGGVEGVIKAKGELYEFIRRKKGKIFINDDNKILATLSNNLEKIKYGSDSGNINGKCINSDVFLSVRWSCKNNNYKVNTNLLGNYNLENILASICIGNHFGISNELINKGIEEYKPDNLRSQIVNKESNTLILDTYNANPTSMKLAISNFIEIKKKNKIAILGDMLELGDVSVEEHENVINQCKSKFSLLILVGEQFMRIAKNNPEVKCFKNIGNLNSYLERSPIKNSTILIKGSRGIKLEDVVSYL